MRRTGSRFKQPVRKNGGTGLGVSGRDQFDMTCPRRPVRIFFATAAGTGSSRVSGAVCRFEDVLQQSGADIQENPVG